MQWTEEQQNAINLRNCNLLVSAGAGSGKTAVLVERIINKVINEKIDINKILVVTFTNAAASEMKERILNKLYEKLEKEPQDLWIQKQIINIGSANITTIHSFCLSVIKQYYYEIGIAPNLKIANEIDNQLMKYEVLQEMFDEQYELEKADESFVNLTEIFNEKSETDNLKDVILKIYNYVINQPFKEKVYSQLLNCLNTQSLVNFETTIWGKTYINQCIDNIKNILAQHDKILEILSDDEKQVDFYMASKNKARELLKIEELKWDECIKCLNSYQLDRRAQLRGYDEQTKGLVAAHWKNVSDLAKELKCDMYEEYILRQNEINRQDLEYLINMVKIFEDRFSQRKKKNKVIDFNDFEHYTLQILLDYDDEKRPIPSSVAKEYQKCFEEILIDEYQDSNYIQEYILNLISRKDEGNPNIFMVGDVKQSIYKFRGAKPEIFLEKYNTYTTNVTEKYVKINLYKNFRSRESILQYINYIFSNIMTKDIGQIDYTQEEFLNYGADYEEISTNNSKIEFDVIDVERQEENIDENIEEDNEENGIERENIEYEAQYVVNKINELIDSGYKVLDKKTKEYREVKYSDIVILLRSTKNTAPIFQQVFKENSMPIYVDNKVGYLDELEVSEVISYLQIIDNPYQDIPLISVLKSPFGNFDDNELADIRQYDKVGYFYTAMQKASVMNQKVNSFLIKLNEYTQKSRYLSVSKLIWDIYEEYKYIAYMKRYKDYENKKANLMLLFERAKQFEESSYKGLFNFINFILKVRNNNQDMGSATILSENDNVIRLMSIHKSKGLEFPVVFLCNTNKKFNFNDLKSRVLLHQTLYLGNEIVDLDKRISYPSIFKRIIAKNMKEEIIAEEMRMLYVALTRAKEKLIITGVTKSYEGERIKAITNMKSKLNSYMDMINYVVYNKGYNKDIFDINCIYSQNNILKSKKSDIAKQEERINLKQQYAYNLGKIEKEEIEKEKYEKISEGMLWAYPKKYLTRLPHKISVSEIKKMNQKDDDEGINIYESITPKLLDDSKVEDKVTPLEKGNIYHYVFEQLDFSRDYTKQELEEIINNMVLITDKEYNVIDINLIYNFTKTTIYQQIKNSEKIYKEHTFMLQENICDIKEVFELEDIQIEDNAETILIQGTIDMFYIYNDEIVIIDYKTDKVKDKNEILNKYKVQLEYYKKALEKTLGKKVKAKYIYLINTSEFIEVK